MLKNRSFTGIEIAAHKTAINNDPVTTCHAKRQNDSLVHSFFLINQRYRWVNKIAVRELDAYPATIFQ